MNQKELRELENRCIQEHAPACTAACPIHVDVRGMLAAVQQGDFDGGLKILRKTVPFPGIISHICEQPCRAVCKRGEADGAANALAIADLEKACVAFGQLSEPISALPGKPKRAAIVGGGLSGMTAAYDLRRKGYQVTIYEAGSNLGGRLWEIPQERLPWPMISQDVAVLEQLGVEIFLDTQVSKVASNGHRPPLALLCQQYDAVYLGTGANLTDLYDLVLDAEGQIQYDPLTYMTRQNGVFVGGSLLHTRQSPSLRIETPTASSELIDAAESRPEWRSAILSVMDGRRAATSMDRYLQKVSLTAARGNEGPYTTRLYTSIAGIAPAPLVPVDDPTRGYERDTAVEEAQRCIQCECMECVKACEYLKEYKGYPKRYVREIYNNLSIVMGTRYSNKFINSCSLCGQCGELCPEDLDMGSICRDARQTMVEQKRMPPSAHDFALRDMAFSNGEKFALARSAPGQTTCTVAFFPGCQLSASAPDYVRKIYAYLGERLPEAQSGGLGLFLRCCGAPADWAGRTDLFETSRAEFIAEYERLGRPKLVLACSSCYQMFKTHYPQVEIISLWEAMDQYGLPAVDQAPLAAPLAVHDPCSTRYESGIQDSVRNILGRLGYTVAELPMSREKTECCSYGGLMWLANPDLAAKAVQRRVSESQQDYVTYCAMCRDFFARQGKPTLHLLDLVYSADPAVQARQPGPGYSQRHENRARLKRALLKELWGELMDGNISYESIHLVISPEVQQLMEDRLILVEDLQQVIETAERSGKKLLNRKTGRFLAYGKPGAVTYWVSYSPQGDGYYVHTAYSHRMEIGEEAQR